MADIMLKFTFSDAGLYEDESEDIRIETEELYCADSWQEACDEAADCHDWDDNDCINRDAKSELSETTRDLKSIEIQNAEGVFEKAQEDVVNYYFEALEKAM